MITRFVAIRPGIWAAFISLALIPSSLNSARLRTAATSWHGSISSPGSSLTVGQDTSTDNTINPNYATNLDGLQHWARFPVKIAFAHDSNYSAERQSAITAGFDQWVAATKAKIVYQVCADPKSADIVVRCDPSMERSETNTDYDVSSSVISHADVTVGLAVIGNPHARMPLTDIRSLAAHEFGHALGIDGHSTSPRDLMFPSLSDNRSVTVRDLNTIHLAYHEMFGISKVAMGKAVHHEFE